MKKIILSIAVLLLVVGCGSATYSNEKVEALDNADMSGYNLFEDEYVDYFKAGDFSLINDLKNNSESYAVFLSYTGCPYCQDSIPVISSSAKEYGVPVVYVNVSDQSLEDDFNEFLTLYVDALEVENGEAKLYVPLMIFVKDGNIKSFHLGTVDGHNPSEAALTENQQKELADIYAKGFKAILN